MHTERDAFSCPAPVPIQLPATLAPLSPTRHRTRVFRHQQSCAAKFAASRGLRVPKMLGSTCTGQARDAPMREKGKISAHRRFGSLAHRPPTGSYRRRCPRHHTLQLRPPVGAPHNRRPTQTWVPALRKIAGQPGNIRAASRRRTLRQTQAPTPSQKTTPRN